MRYRCFAVANAIAAAFQNWTNARLERNRWSNRRLVALERLLKRFIGRDLIIEKGGANIGRNYVRSVDHASAAVVWPLPELLF